MKRIPVFILLLVFVRCWFVVPETTKHIGPSVLPYPDFKGYNFAYVMAGRKSGQWLVLIKGTEEDINTLSGYSDCYYITDEPIDDPSKLIELNNKAESMGVKNFDHTKYTVY
jgi:hypothetical protein